MSYCSLEDAKLFYSKNEIDILIKERNGDLNIAAFEAALKSASSEIDIYLSRRYKTPLTREYKVIPEIVKEWVAIIAVYKRSRELDLRTDEKRLRYEDVIALLKDIASGKANLTDEGKLPPNEQGDPNSEAGKYSAFLEGPPRIFTRSKMQGL